MGRNQAFVFDLDGTLVDSVCQHVLAWQEALDRAGIEVSVWRIHRRIGMSGGLLAHALLRETGRPMNTEALVIRRDVAPGEITIRGHLVAQRVCGGIVPPK
jgi:beta-phosphoglucomutase-like phosphatase (HAD superfamily)